jgi:hypothetical protein
VPNSVTDLNLTPKYRVLCGLHNITHGPITPNFLSGSSREIVGDYVEDRCWPTTFHTITTEDANGWC